MTADAVRILYVEDEEDIRLVAEYALDDEGFEILFCASGEEALNQAASFRPELILLDVMMPGMDGPETLKGLRELSGLKSTPVAFLTAKVQPSEIEEFMAMGALEVIAKPFDPMTLADQIRNLLVRHND